MLIFYPVGWDPNACDALDARYPRETFVCDASTLMEVLYRVVAGRVPREDEFVPLPERFSASRNEDGTLRSEWVVANVWSLLQRGSIADRWENPELPPPERFRAYHVGYDGEPVTRENCPEEYCFDGIGGYSYYGFYTTLYMVTFPYSRAELLRRYLRQSGGEQFLDVLDALEAPYRAEFLLNGGERAERAREAMIREGEKIENILYGGELDPLASVALSVQFYVQSYRQKATPGSERLQNDFVPANRLSQWLLDQGFMPAEFGFDQSLR